MPPTTYEGKENMGKGYVSINKKKLNPLILKLITDQIWASK
jgi:hypothetical protein